MAKLTIGRFTLDTETFAIEGPADYMAARYRAKIADIEAGRCSAFNAGCTLSPTKGHALLVSLQTDYAGWHGMRDFRRTAGY